MPLPGELTGGQIVGVPPLAQSGTLPGELTGGKILPRPDDVAGYSRSTGAAAHEVGRQFVGGVAVDLPRMVGQGLQYAFPGTTAGQGMIQDANASEEQYAPHTAGQGMVGGALALGARGIGPMLPAVAAGLLPGGQVLAPAIAAATFGPSTAYETENKLLSQGVDPDSARQAGYLTGGIMGVGGAAAMGIGRAAFSGVKGALGAGPTMDSVLDTLTTAPGIGGAAAKIGLAGLEQAGVMAGQGAGIEGVERAYGAAPEDMGHILKSSVEAAVGLTALLGPFAAGAQIGHARRARAFDFALNNPGAPPEIRALAEEAVQKQALAAGVPPEQVTSWVQDRQATPPATGSGGADILHGETPADAEKAQAATNAATQAAGLTNTSQPPAPPPASVAPPMQAPTAPVAPRPIDLPPQATTDPAVLAQQQAQVAQAQDQTSKVDQAKQQIQARQQAEAAQAAAKEQARQDLGGDAAGKIPSRYTDAMALATELRDNQKITPEQHDNAKVRLIASLQTQDSKTLQAVRKELQSVKAPPAPEPTKEPVNATPPAAESKLAEPAPAGPAAESPNAVPRAPEPEPVAATAVQPAAPESAAPVAAPAAKSYEQYEGRSVSVEVPHPDPNRKPIRRTVKNARAALEEADDRITKFQELAKCLQGAA